MGADFKYDEHRQRHVKAKRHPLNVLFDPFYPIIIVAIGIMALFWYLGIPMGRLFDGVSFDGPRHFLGRWLP